MLRVENAKLERMLMDATSSNLSKPDQDRTSTLIHSEMALRLCNLEDDNRNLRQRISELLAREAQQEHAKNSAVDLHDKLRKLLEDSEEKQSIIFRLSEEADTLRSQAALARKYQESTERLLQENQSIAEVLSEVRDKLKPDGDLQAAQTQNQELRTMLDTLRADLDRTQRNYRELNDRHKALQSSYASKSAEASQIEVLVAENQRLSEGFGELRGLHSLLTREKEQLQTELSNYMQSYSEQTTELQNRCFNAENLVKTLKSRIEELMAANTALVKELEISSSRNKTVAELEDRLRVSEAERDSLRRVCDDLKAHHNAASSELADLKKNSIRFIGLEQQFASQSQELRTLRSLTESQEVKSKSLQQQVYVLDTELVQVKRDKSILEKLCEEQSSSITELQKLKEHKTQAASQEFTIKELEQKVLTLTNQIRGLVDANSELRAKLQGTLQTSNQHHLDNLPLEDSNKLRCLLQQLDTEHTLSKQRELELKSTVASLEGKIRAFESSEGDLMRTRHDNIALRAEIEDVRFENKRLKADLLQERTQNTNLKNIHSEVKMIEVDLSAKEIALQDAYKKIQLLEGELSRNTTESKHRHNSIQGNHAKLLEENSHLKQMLDKQKQELNQIYEKLSLLSSLELNHKDASEELKLVKEQNAELTQQLDRQQNERQAMLQKFDLRLKQIESDRTGSIQTEGVLREELQALRTQTHQASDKLVSLRIKEKRLLAADDEIKQLQQENFQLRKQIVQDLKQAPPTEPMEIEKLKTEAETLRVRVNELVRLLDELRNYNLELETANIFWLINLRFGEIPTANRSIPTLNAQLELLQSRIGEKESAIKTLSTQLQQQGVEGLLGMSQSETNKRRSHEEFLQGLVEENNHRIGGLEVLLEEEKKAHRQTKREVALHSEELERCRTLAQEVKDLRRTHAELEEQALRCAGELELVKEAKEHCDREIEGLASKNVLLMGALQQSDASDSQLKLAMAEAQRLSDKVQLLTSVKTEQESVIENQERELAEKRNQIVELETILEALDHRCNTLQQEANDVRTDRETLLSKIRQLEQVFTTEANSAERNTHDLTSQNHLLRDRLQSVGDSLQMTQQENRFLMEEVQTARQQLDQAQKERSEAMSLLLRAQKELELHGHTSKMVQHSDLGLLQDRIALLTEILFVLNSLDVNSTKGHFVRVR